MNTRIFVVGSLNTDITISGVAKIIGPGEYAKGKKVLIGPGGKSRNIAQMIAEISTTNKVYMLGKTVKDHRNLWEVPIKALKQAGVNISYLVYDSDTSKMPGIALISVDTKGNNQIYVAAGVSDEISESDIDQWEKNLLMSKTKRNYAVMTLEFPYRKTAYLLKKFNKHSCTTMLDPGGITNATDLDFLQYNHLDFIKPNEHEAETLTGIRIIDLGSAKKASVILRNKYKVDTILITAGKNGGYLYTDDRCLHIPAPNLPQVGTTADETGCGDQTMAGIVSALVEGKNIVEACMFGIMLGTMQFQRNGVQPVKANEVPFLN